MDGRSSFKVVVMTAWKHGRVLVEAIAIARSKKQVKELSPGNIRVRKSAEDQTSSASLRIKYIDMPGPTNRVI